MKRTLLVITMIFSMYGIEAQEIIAFESEGNLETLNLLVCVELTEVTNQHTPADILKGMEKCLKGKEYEKAAKLFAISGLYGSYDMLRVEDKTAHQAMMVLQQNVIFTLNEEDGEALKSALEIALEKDSETLKSTCQTIRNIGPPQYHPAYMIQHGMKAFLQSEDDGIVKDFNSEESWKSVLKNYLYCAEK